MDASRPTDDADVRPRVSPGATYLEQLVDRQFSFLSTRDGDRLLMTVARVLALVAREPALAAILREQREEVAAAVDAYRAHEVAMMAALGRAFRAHRETLARHAGTEGFDRETLEGYERSLVPLEHLEYPVNEEPRWDRASSRHRLSRLRYWVTAARERATEVAERAALLNTEDELSRLRDEHEEAFRAYRTAGVTLPGAAHARLAWAVTCINPRAADEAHLAREREELAEMLHEPTKRRLLIGAPGAEVLLQVRRDAELLREELVLALGRERALGALVSAYVERARRFHRARLARAFAGPTAAAERAFALVVAEHLHERGVRAHADAKELGPGEVLVQAKLVARPTPARLRAAIARGLERAEAARRARGVASGALVLVHTAGPRVDLPARVHGEVALSLASLHLGEIEGALTYTHA